MTKWLLELLIWIVLVSSVTGLLYTSGALSTARKDRDTIISRGRNGARLIAVKGRITQERLAVAVMLSYLLAGLGAWLAPPGWARAAILPLMVVGIALTALKSYHRTRTRRKAIEYLDHTVPEQVPIEVVDAVDEAGKLDITNLKGASSG